MKKLLIVSLLVLGSMTAMAGEKCTKAQVEKALSSYSENYGGISVRMGGLAYAIPFESFSSTYKMSAHPEMPDIKREVIFKYKGKSKKTEGAYYVGGKVHFSGERLNLYDKVYQFIAPMKVDGVVIMDEDCSTALETIENSWQTNL